METTIKTITNDFNYQVIVDGLIFNIYKLKDVYQIDFNYDTAFFFECENFNFDDFYYEYKTLNDCLISIKNYFISINY